MYAPSIFFSSFQSLTENAVYRMILEAFTAGHWRYTALCEKLGLVKKPLEDDDNRLLEKLTVCTSQQQIDVIFEHEEIADLRERCNVLRRCMRIQEILGDVGVFPNKTTMILTAPFFLRALGELCNNPLQVHTIFIRCSKSSASVLNNFRNFSMLSFIVSIAAP